MLSRSTRGIISLASQVLSNTSRRRNQFSSSVIFLKGPREGPPLERLVPPKRPSSVYMVYTSERYKDSKGEKLSLSP